MSIREKLNAQRWKAQLITLAGFALFGFGGVVASTHKQLWPLPLLGFLAFFGGSLYQGLGLRCPRCREALGYVIVSSGKFFSVPEKFRFCPYCGTSLDIEIDDTAKV